MSPLEKKLQGMGPVRNDGSDKFFGMENVCATRPGSLRMLTKLTCSTVVPGKPTMTPVQTKIRNRTFANPSPAVTATQSYNAYTFPFPFANRSSIIPRERRSSVWRRHWPKLFVFKTPTRTSKLKPKPRDRDFPISSVLARRLPNPRNPRTRSRPTIKRKSLYKPSHS